MADPWAQRPDTLPALVAAKPELFVDLKKAPADVANPAEWAIEQMRATEASARLYFPLGDKGVSKRLHRITAPTLLVWGSEDKVLPPGHADLFASGIRVGKELRIIRGAGHLAELDEPKETAMAVLQWVRHAG
jgi:pimeloyl-ACP methyl ester carboxylesterase